MNLSKTFIIFFMLFASFSIFGSSSLTTPSELFATRNGRITQKEQGLLKTLKNAVDNRNYEQAYSALDDLRTFVKARSDLFISEIPIIVNPVGQEISRMIQVTRSNQIDSILTLTDSIEDIVQPSKDLYHTIMRAYHNLPPEQRAQRTEETLNRRREAEHIYSNIIVPADDIESILTKLERLFIIAHLRNFYFLTTKTGSFGSGRSNITGQQYSPYVPNRSQQSSANQPEQMYP